MDYQERNFQKRSLRGTIAHMNEIMSECRSDIRFTDAGSSEDIRWQTEYDLAKAKKAKAIKQLADLM
ncbi:hypothetical protein PT287_07710 [Lactobacillus sp. ESL0679]|uniref:hypothetical protein n=1 Tax=Lactobacillus sp. ESL0679 TaxID=2983209 RepID=UPI0023F83438|nr:hypothetical protein [Lactobacillus sp. ESL0679]MDF7683386.1 hypothetical protein [Lactobacillus sp. ESL0679]